MVRLVKLTKHLQENLSWKQKEMMKLRETITRVYVQRIGTPLWVVSEDMERDVFMLATEAQAHGIVEHVGVE